MQRRFIPIDMPRVATILCSIAGQLNFRAVIRAAANEIRDILPHDHLDVAMMSPDGTMVSAYETGLHTEWDADTTATKPVAVSPIRTLFRGEVDFIITEDAQTDLRFHFDGAFSTPIFAVGLHSRLHVPLKVEGRVIGALSFSTQQRNSYSNADISNAQTVADILLGYLFALQQSELARQIEIRQVETAARAEGLRIGARQLTEELEHARHAIGMDLHDQTLADLSRIARNLKRLTGKTTLRGQELQPLEEDVNHCLRELRVIVDDARPSVLELFGFAQAIEALLERCARTAPLKWQMHDTSGSALDALPATIQVALYRIVQEAVTNSGRHSGAGLIEVRIWLEGHAAVISVRDDGCGIPQAVGQRNGGLGNMRTRASLIEAELAITSNPDGTEVLLAVPLPPIAQSVAEPDLVPAKVWA